MCFLEVAFLILYNVDMYINTVDKEKIKGFFTDKNGTSESPYMNYDVRRSLGLSDMPWVRIKQVHGDNIAYPDKITGDTVLDGYDAMITDRSGICLVTVHADCVPVQLYDEKRNVIAAVHAGWRGSALGISAKAARIMREEFGCEDIKGYIGPAISMCCYEVGDEVASEFPDYEGAVSVKDGRSHVDLKTVNRIQLEKAGVKDVEVSGICTCCNDKYVSYRRSKTVMRMASGIYMLP